MICGYCLGEMLYERCAETGRTVYVGCDCALSNSDLPQEESEHPKLETSVTSEDWNTRKFLTTDEDARDEMRLNGWTDYSPYQNEMNPVTGMPFEEVA